MSVITAGPAAEGTLRRWDAFVAAGHGGTLFHTLRFLAYHGDRFAARERHLELRKGGALLGVLPLAVDGDAARSPYGASYGGPVFAAPPGYAESVAAARAIVDAVRGLGARSLTMTLPVGPCHAVPCDTFRHALVECGFALANRDVSSVVPLGPDVDAGMRPRARNAARKAERLGVRLRRDVEPGEFWPVLEGTMDRHGAQATHTLDQWRALVALCPGEVRTHVALAPDGEPVAGIALLRATERVDSSFYLAQTARGRQAQALSLLVAETLRDAARAGDAWFDFGTTTHMQVARPQLFLFKEGFGALGVFRETYRWEEA